MKYFIDANIVIEMVNKRSNTLEEIIKEEDSELFINRLVVLEVLRTEQNKDKIQKIEKVLREIEPLDIKKEIYDEVVEFSRFCEKNKIKIKGKCPAIDFIHFVTAKHYGLEVSTSDADFKTLNERYEEFKK